VTQRRRVRVDTPQQRKQRVVPPAISREPAPADDEPVDEATPEPAECRCPRLEAADWHEVESDWSDITFLRTHCRAALGVPVGFRAAEEQLRARAKELDATIPDDAMTLLGEGRFRREFLVEVEGVAAGARDVFAPGGVAYTRLAGAPWGQINRERKATEEAARKRYGRSPDDLWVWYLTCRHCSGEREYETLFVAHFRDRR
jgi:hypothetical protein